VAGWFRAGISIFVAGAVLQLVLWVVVLGKIESPTSHIWVTFNIVAMLLWITGFLIVSVSRSRQRR
jgi:hypothetical protein